MKKSNYNKQAQKAPKKQVQQTGAMSKLAHAHNERGMKEPNNKVKHYYTILSNGRILDFSGLSRAHAKLFFADEAKVKFGLNEEIQVRAYQK